MSDTGPGFSTDWFSTRIPVWEELFGHLRGRPDVHVVEIGSWEGMSACWLLREVLTHETSTLTCVDLFEHGHGASRVVCDFEAVFDANIGATGAADRVSKVRGPSARVLRALPFGHFDAVYVDGSHRACDVLADAVLAWPLLRTDGLLLFDDYEWIYDGRPLWQPRAGIDAFVSVFADQVEVVHRGWQLVVRRAPG